MNEQKSKILTEKYKYMFSEMERSLVILKKQTELIDEFTKASANNDEILISQIREDQKEAGSYYPIAFGFECDDGWFELLDDVMGKIKEVDIDKIVVIHQIKEKYGGLRISIRNGTDEIYNLIDEAENKSLEVCEACGQPGELCEANNWLKTVCPEHRQLVTWTGTKQFFKPVKK